MFLKTYSGGLRLLPVAHLHGSRNNFLIEKPLQPTEANSLLNLSRCKINPSRNTVHKIYSTECSMRDKDKIYLYISISKPNSILGCVSSKY